MNEKTKILSKPWQNKEWLKTQYFDNKLSFNKIGKLCGKSDKNIQHWFKKFGLKSRPSPFTNRDLYKGKNNPRWIGGRVFDARGYIRIYYPEDHAYKGKNQKYVLEHVLVMEKKLGRPLEHPEMVHHKNGVPGDNHINNLLLMSGPFEHNTHEQHLNKFAKHVIFGDLAPHLKKELSSLFDKFLSSLVNER